MSCNRSRNRWPALTVAATLAMVGCASTGATPTATGTGDAASTSASTDRTVGGSVDGAVGSAGDRSVALLARAGIGTVVDETTTTPILAPATPSSVLTVTAWQAASFDSELADGTGWFGVDLDRVAPVATGLPTMSFVVAAWLRHGAGPIVDAARQVMPAPDGATPPSELRFPTIVLTMFVADVAAHGDDPQTSDTSGAATGSSTGPANHLASRQLGVGAPCSTVANFVNDTLNRVFDALHIDAAAAAGYANGALGGGVAGTIGGAVTGWLAGLVNDAVELARGAIEGLISVITKPVVDAIRLAIGSVATVTTIVSYLKRWQAPVTAPNDPDRFAVGDEPDRNGSLTVKVDSAGETDDWPPLLKDCASVVGLDLPTLSKEHMPVTWRVLWQSAPDLVTFHADGPPFQTELDRALESTLTYTTGHEDDDQGQEVTSGIEIGVSIRRTEIDRLKQLISGFLLGQVPGVVRTVVGPLLQSYIDLALGHLDEITAVEGSVLLRVSHHEPPDPTTTTQPRCVAGPPIPAGTYQAHDVTGQYALTESKPGTGTISGTIDDASMLLHSDGTNSSGQIAVHWAGEGDLLIAGSTSHIAEDSTLHDAVISGPVTDPVVDGTITGTETVDGEAESGSRPVHVHLHVVDAGCDGLRTDIIAMLDDMVANELSTVAGAGTFAAPWSPA